ncbi:P-loop NTPase fold protein [Nitrosomonas sp.]|uniref:KAP family P-loop NTPase fold protein n=1 Tax=Nitrosomonas sp. TaxID=42353 RepID=UPI00207FDA2A|nr:P-loop NTPase fold protein [Nitrosomonas sp.]GJL75336.1 MAG: hypothetical protein NMNS02_14420 [Nitrosomonas sp.]
MEKNLSNIQESNKKQVPLTIRRNNQIKNAFDGDVLERRKTAKILTKYIERLKAGAVLAIDAPWGEGKTWFGLNWAKQLEDEYGHKVVYINSFKQDYIEDAFILIASEIQNALDNKKINTLNFKEKATNVINAYIPVASKILIRTLGRLILNTAEQEVNQEIADTTSSIIKEKINNYSEDKSSVESFINELKTICANEEKPIVIFIDELDRCKPTFAVQIIERIKHLFDVPNLVFVLLLHRKQLENAIIGVYGKGTDAQTYLGKFINLFFCLPKNYTRNEDQSISQVSTFITNELKRYGYETCVYPETNLKDQIADNFKNELSEWVIAKRMSLRDIEHACALFIMSNIRKKDGLLSYLIALKIKEKDLYNRLLLDEKEAHREAANNLSKLINNDYDIKEWPNLYFKMLEECHFLHIGSFKTVHDCQYLKNHSKRIFDTKITSVDFRETLNKIDLPLEIK